MSHWHNLKAEVRQAVHGLFSVYDLRHDNAGKGILELSVDGNPMGHCQLVGELDNETSEGSLFTGHLEHGGKTRYVATYSSSYWNLHPSTSVLAVAKRFESGEGHTVAGLLRKTVGPLCVVRKAQMELSALKETDLNFKARRQRLLGSRCFMRPYCIALGDTEEDAWLIMERLDLVRVWYSPLSALKRTP
jgi:hypothetical protein